MAEGADLSRHILSTVAVKVPALRCPLGRWSAPFLVDAIRAAAKASPTVATASSDATDIRGVRVPNDRILRRVRDYLQTGIWPDDVRDRWGPAPDEFGTCIPPSLFRWTPTEGPMPEVKFRGNLIPEANLRMMVFKWQRTGQWFGAWGYPPDDDRTSVPLRFRRQRLPQASHELSADDEAPF